MCTCNSNVIKVISYLQKVLNTFWFVTVALTTDSLNLFHLTSFTGSLRERERGGEGGREREEGREGEREDGKGGREKE